jgi:cytochrome b
MSATMESGVRPGPAAPREATRATIRVWDPLVRLFHWTLAAGFTVAWATGDELERVHPFAGYLIAALLVSRILWGFIGETHARFADFVRPPSAVAAHLLAAARFRARRYLGHNPAGGAMVIAFLVVLGLTAGTGILMTAGGYGDVEWLEETHEFLANFSLLLVALHLAGVLGASIEHRENLARAMVTGRKRGD